MSLASGAFDVLVGYIVIGNESNARGIEDAVGNLTTHVNGDGRRDVVGMHQVESVFYQLSGDDLAEPACAARIFSAMVIGRVIRPALPR